MTTTTPKPPSSEVALHTRFIGSLGLMAVIWLSGLLGHFTPFLEWPALLFYVIGSISLVMWRGFGNGEWTVMYLSGGALGGSLKWGGIAGLVLFIMDVTNTVIYYRNGGPPMGDMLGILVNMNFLYFFPLLVLAEELLWRGIMFSAMIAKGFNGHVTVLLTTIFYMLTHFAVAPVGLHERALMAMMAMPIGILGGYIVLRSHNVWGSVLVHMITMLSMILDIFVIPQLLV